MRPGRNSGPSVDGHDSRPRTIQVARVVTRSAAATSGHARRVALTKSRSPTQYARRAVSAASRSLRSRPTRSPGCSASSRVTNRPQMSYRWPRAARNAGRGGTLLPRPIQIAGCALVAAVAGTIGLPGRRSGRDGWIVAAELSHTRPVTVPIGTNCPAEIDAGVWYRAQARPDSLRVRSRSGRSGPGPSPARFAGSGSPDSEAVGGSPRGTSAVWASTEQGPVLALPRMPILAVGRGITTRYDRSGSGRQGRRDLAGSPARNQPGPVRERGRPAGPRRARWAGGPGP